MPSHHVTVPTLLSLALLTLISFPSLAVPAKGQCPQPSHFQGHSIAPTAERMQRVALATHCVWMDASKLELNLSRRVQSIVSESTFEGRSELLKEQQQWRQIAVKNCSDNTRKQLGLSNPEILGQPALFPEFYARCIRERISQRLEYLNKRPLR